MSGSELFSMVSLKSFSSIVFSDEALSENETYIVNIGNDSYEIALNGKCGSYGNTYEGMGGGMFRKE